MFTSHTAACSNQLTFGNLIFDYHLNVGKGFAELTVKWQEALRSAQRLIDVVRKTMSDTVGGKHFGNGICPSLIPDFVKPTTNEGFIFFADVCLGHEDSPLVSLFGVFENCSRKDAKAERKVRLPLKTFHLLTSFSS